MKQETTGVSCLHKIQLSAGLLCVQKTPEKALDTDSCFHPGNSDRLRWHTQSLRIRSESCVLKKNVNNVECIDVNQAS